MQTLKSLGTIAAEYGFTVKTLRNHVKKHEVLIREIKSGVQPPKAQKLFYETLGYPPCVNKNDYENV